MRHIQMKSNSGSKSNVGPSGSGAKVTSVSQKAGATKRIQGEPVKSSKKRKTNDSPSKSKSLTIQKHLKEGDAEKAQKKLISASAGVKKSCVNAKKLKKPIEKSKKVNTKLDKKGKVPKRCKVTEKGDENDGPPTLSETFSRITTTVAETVISEKESQRLGESLMAKVKKESENSSSSKGKGETSALETGKSKKASTDGDSSKAKTQLKKTDLGKKVKSTFAKSKITKAKIEPKKSKLLAKKLSEKATLDNTENLVKVLKDEEIPLAFGKGIGTRRKSTAGSAEGEQKPEPSDSNKSKGETAGKAEVQKKKVVKIVTKKVVKNVPKKVVIKKEKPKSKVAEIQIKKASDEMKKNVEKVKEEPSVSKELLSQKKCIPKKETTRAQPSVKKKTGKSSPMLKKKDVKSPKPKFGSETDGSNSDELTLSIIQKKTKKTKTDGEKLEGIDKPVKKNFNSDEIKESPDEKVTETEKTLSKSKKVKTKKEEKIETTSKKILENAVKDKKKAKETESDTDEDMELRRIMAKKLGRTVKSMSEAKKKKPEVGKNVQETDQRTKRMKLFGFWSGPKRHRVASLNAIAKVHCLYENESKGVLAEIEKMSQVMKFEEKRSEIKEEKPIKSETKGVIQGRKIGKDLGNSDMESKRSLRGTFGGRGSGKHWDMLAGDSTSTSSASSDEGNSSTEKSKGKKLPLQPSYRQKMFKKEDAEKSETAKAPKRRRNNEIGVTMDLKDMVVRKRMASLNASAILAASYSIEKRSNRKDSSGTSTEDGMSSIEDNDRFFSDDADNTNKGESKKSSEQEKAPEEKNKQEEQNVPECTEYRHKKHFWKTKVESLKKSSKENRNSPSPILADFGVEKDLSTTVLEKEKKDELNEDKEKDKTMKLGYPPRKFLEGKLKGKTLEGKLKNLKSGGKEEKDDRRKYSKRKLCEEDVKNINIEKMKEMEKPDEYEYKSDSDNGQRKLIELRNTGGSNKKVAVIVNQDTDVTITGVYVNSTRSTHHEGFCSIAGMQYRISSTSHTQTEATAVLKTSTASEQTPSPSEPRNCTSPRGHKSYTPLSALSNMQPPAGAPHTHLPPPPHHHHHLCGMGQHRPPPDHYMGHGPISHQRPMSPLGRRHGCTSAFTAPHCSSHPAAVDHMPGPAENEGFGSSLPAHGFDAVVIPIEKHAFLQSIIEWCLFKNALTHAFVENVPDT
ncbi:hypothetical protein RUM44_004609 [Polyplax serrata]|uniref:Uncharacterized protein n=1 Tax=Polyplax serrata TaxID=468196 RepID=A0ABR1B556_POLSC